MWINATGPPEQTEKQVGSTHNNDAVVGKPPCRRELRILDLFSGGGGVLADAFAVIYISQRASHICLIGESTQWPRQR